jgi:hypothetical protein
MNVSSLISLIFLCICILSLGFLYYSNLKKNKDNEQLKKLFENLKDVIEEAMIEYLKQVDITNITNISNMQQEILEGLYDTVWDMVIKEVTDMYVEDKVLGEAIKALLTRKTVEDMVNRVFLQSTSVQEQITSKYNDAVLSAHK